MKFCCCNCCYLHDAVDVAVVDVDVARCVAIAIEGVVVVNIFVLVIAVRSCNLVLR